MRAVYQSSCSAVGREELAGARRQLESTQAELSKGQAAARDAETQLQDLRSRLAGYEDTQRAYQARCGCSLMRAS